MSASLVGSEMCIRDSLEAVPPARRDANKCLRPARVAQRRTASSAPTSVSYTHLTLPTICSV
eukprot:15422831-Alexandrium_andersonii.AAC.1